MRRRPHLLKEPGQLRVRPSLKDVRRVLAKIEEDEKGCWIWQGYCDDAGYGQASFQKKVLWVYRLTYAMFRGSIPKGKTVDHRCLNPSCCNPWHCCLKTLGKNSGEANKRRSNTPF